ncbi:MAG: hypothetical protein U0232_21615 [Thermomicrobiales bacterium]
MLRASSRNFSRFSEGLAVARSYVILANREGVIKPREQLWDGVAADSLAEAIQRRGALRGVVVEPIGEWGTVERAVLQNVLLLHTGIDISQIRGAQRLRRDHVVARQEDESQQVIGRGDLVTVVEAAPRIFADDDPRLRVGEVPLRPCT